VYFIDPHEIWPLHPFNTHTQSKAGFETEKPRRGLESLALEKPETTKTETTITRVFRL
jgi:hypothetical protein